MELINQKKSPIQDDYIEKYLAEKDLNLTATLQKIGKLKLDLDDFREVNKKIFDFEEKEMESNKAYRILSLLCVSLLDLGLLEIEEET